MTSLSCIVKKIFVFLLVFQWTFAISLMPQIFYVDLDKPTTQELILINDSNEPTRFKISIKPTDEKGWEMNAIDEEWVRFYPKIVAVGPQSEGVVRFRVNPPKGVRGGEYKAYISVEEIGLQRPVEEAGQGDDISIGLGMMYDFHLSIYGQKGEMDYQAKVNNINIIQKGGKKAYRFDIKNTGNASLRGVFKVSYLDKRNKVISQEEIGIGVIPMSQEKNIDGEFEKFNDKAVSVKFEFYHFDFSTKKMGVKVFEKINSL